MTGKKEIHNPTLLSNREYQVAQLLDDGLDDKQIAQELDITRSTVRTTRRLLSVRRNKLQRTVELLDELSVFEQS
jgi:DNA-binding NarL/FixJ family response regulator